MVRMERVQKTTLELTVYKTPRIAKRLEKIYRYNCGFKLSRKSRNEFTLRGGKFWYRVRIEPDVVRVKITNIVHPLEMVNARATWAISIIKQSNPWSLVECQRVVTRGKYLARHDLVEFCMFIRSKGERAYVRNNELVACHKSGAIFLRRNGEFVTRGLNDYMSIIQRTSSLSRLMTEFARR